MEEALKVEFDIVNKIKIEKSFADSIYKDFKAERFGISKCCYQDTQSASIKKYLCDWQDLMNNSYDNKEEFKTKLITCN
tara:strand:+ start:327 stop:563 length:237 start_codon:yes stop_codon:yes gene_type:complete